MKHRPQVYILSAPVQSGKTTAVYRWAKEQKSVGGFLTPDVDGLRYTYLPYTKKWLAFETKNANENQPIVNVGKFRFFQTAFDTMEKTLIDDLRKGLDWVVLDELGKLEIRGIGLAEVATTALAFVTAGETESKLLLIVREELLDSVVEHFSIVHYHLVKISDFQNSRVIT